MLEFNGSTRHRLCRGADSCSETSRIALKRHGPIEKAWPPTHGGSSRRLSETRHRSRRSGPIRGRPTHRHGKGPLRMVVFRCPSRQRRDRRRGFLHQAQCQPERSSCAEDHHQHHAARWPQIRQNSSTPGRISSPRRSRVATSGSGPTALSAISIATASRQLSRRYRSRSN